MPKPFFQHSAREQRDALGFAAERLGRPAAILEKDVMVVWTLGALYASEHGDSLSFKGGTSLSKVYGLIDRFSEDIDITYDIRRFLTDFDISEDGIPASKSQATKWTKEVREKLPAWISDDLVPLLDAQAKRDGVRLRFEQETKERLHIHYEPLHAQSSSYIRSAVMLEFGARSTGEPVASRGVLCDAAAVLGDIELPSATVRAMQVGRTFWEKATAAHVYCAQQNLKGDRFSRHWHDIHYIKNSEHYEPSVSDRQLAGKVAVHKSFFFAERDKDREWVDYVGAVHGGIRMVPDGEALDALRRDYGAMRDAGTIGNLSKL